MSSGPVYIMGAGGHAREVLGVLRAMQRSGSRLEFKGFVADDEPDEDILRRIAAHWLGPIDSCVESVAGAGYVVGIGDPSTRKVVAKRCEEAGLHAVTLVHPTVSLGEDVNLEPGSVIFDHVSATTNIRVGRHTHISRNSTIGHDVRIGDYAMLNPMVAISGNVEICDGAQIGTHAAILQGLRVGSNAVVGAGACVIRDVRSGTTVVGVPASPLA